MKAPEKGSGSFSDDNDAASRQFPAVRRRAPAHAEIPEINIVLIARQPRIDLPGIAQHIVQRGVESPALRCERTDAAGFFSALGEPARIVRPRKRARLLPKKVY